MRIKFFTLFSLLLLIMLNFGISVKGLTYNKVIMYSDVSNSSIESNIDELVDLKPNFIWNYTIINSTWNFYNITNITTHASDIFDILTVKTEYVNYNNFSRNCSYLYLESDNNPYSKLELFPSSTSFAIHNNATVEFLFASNCSETQLAIWITGYRILCNLDLTNFYGNATNMKNEIIYCCIKFDGTISAWQFHFRPLKNFNFNYSFYSTTFYEGAQFKIMLSPLTAGVNSYFSIFALESNIFFNKRNEVGNIGNATYYNFKYHNLTVLETYQPFISSYNQFHLISTPSYFNITNNDDNLTTSQLHQFQENYSVFINPQYDYYRNNIQLDSCHFYSNDYWLKPYFIDEVLMGFVFKINKNMSRIAIDTSIHNPSYFTTPNVLAFSLNGTYNIHANDSTLLGSFLTTNTENITVVFELRNGLNLSIYIPELNLQYKTLTFPYTSTSDLYFYMYDTTESNDYIAFAGYYNSTSDYNEILKLGYTNATISDSIYYNSSTVFFDKFLYLDLNASENASNQDLNTIHFITANLNTQQYNVEYNNFTRILVDNTTSNFTSDMSSYFQLEYELQSAYISNISSYSHNISVEGIIVFSAYVLEVEKSILEIILEFATPLLFLIMFPIIFRNYSKKPVIIVLGILVGLVVMYFAGILDLIYMIILCLLVILPFVCIMKNRSVNRID